MNLYSVQCQSVAESEDELLGGVIIRPVVSSEF